MNDVSCILSLWIQCSLPSPSTCLHVRLSPSSACSLSSDSARFCFVLSPLQNLLTLPVPYFIFSLCMFFIFSICKCFTFCLCMLLVFSPCKFITLSLYTFFTISPVNYPLPSPCSFIPYLLPVHYLFLSPYTLSFTISLWSILYNLPVHYPLSSPCKFRMEWYLFIFLTYNWFWNGNIRLKI